MLGRDIDEMTQLQWHMVVLDEAQAIKNASSKATHAGCRLDTRHRLCLSGTPSMAIRSAIPRTPLRGVRISCPIRATNMLLARLARAASIRDSTRPVRARDVVTDAVKLLAMKKTPTSRKMARLSGWATA